MLTNWGLEHNLVRAGWRPGNITLLGYPGNCSAGILKNLRVYKAKPYKKVTHQVTSLDEWMALGVPHTQLTAFAASLVPWKRKIETGKGGVKFHGSEYKPSLWFIAYNRTQGTPYNPVDPSISSLNMRSFLGWLHHWGHVFGTFIPGSPCPGSHGGVMDSGIISVDKTQFLNWFKQVDKVIRKSTSHLELPPHKQPPKEPVDKVGALY